VNNGTFDPWAVKMSEKFDNAEDVTGTPSVKVNGEKIETPSTPEEFEAVVGSKLKK
jgi:protein-disulfide isomerase